ncbi:IS256 family transposase [Phaeodactylibacter sp.]|uniref:IS256 family transposase n=1 Tax=Phaeodactylibacter sp. TaxID=1940289 RepID=UPI0025E5DDD4|nr:IS256 family transposase [Phaeodactylibacter sp.]MCI4649020.1 IS256 family transposase [Phaeodactylibacter sp.]MCI5090778.1 IS256 family transposase [Phaeodactylibacter sp.]
MSKQPKKGAVSDFDFESYRQTVIQGLMQGKGLTGEEGLLKPLIANFIEGALSAELEDNLAQSKAEGTANKRNGKQSKQIRTESGEVEVHYSRDREGTFEPLTVKKRHHEFGLRLDNQILELYAMSNSVSDIRTHLERMYGAQMSESRISNVINQTWDRVEAWRNAPLAPMLAVLFIDAVHVDVRRDGQVRRIALYVMYGISIEGERQVIALIPGQGAEGAVEWGRCLEQLKQRGLQDVLYICSDGLSGLREVIAEAFPLANIQRCVVHKIRNTFRLLDEKDSRQVLRQLKEVYHAVNEAEARRKLDDFGRYWDGKYDLVVNLWLKDWEDLMGCMNLSPALKKLIYTTNAIENLNREIRRVTKAKAGWVSDRALLIQLFLALDRKRSSWNKNVFEWNAIHRELAATHGERFTKYIS